MSELLRVECNPNCKLVSVVFIFIFYHKRRAVDKEMLMVSASSIALSNVNVMTTNANLVANDALPRSGGVMAGDLTTSNVTVLGTATFGSNVLVAGTMLTCSNAIVSDTLYTSNLHLTGALYQNGDLVVDGNVGIGTTHSSVPLTVVATPGNPNTVALSVTGDVTVTGASAFSSNVTIAGSVGIGTSPPLQALDVSGYVKTTHCAFVARGKQTGGVTSTTPGGAIQFASVLYNIGKCYNDLTYTFTAPVQGVYSFSGTFTTSGAVANAVSLDVSGIWAQVMYFSSCTGGHSSFSGLMQLSKGAPAYVAAISDSAFADRDDTFQGALLYVTAPVPIAPTIGMVTFRYDTNDVNALIEFSDPLPHAQYTYTATSITGDHTGSSLTSPIEIKGLTDFTAYAFTVFATDLSGAASPPSALSVTVPGAPRSVVPTPGNGLVTVAFAPPTSDGGYSITSYTAVSSNLTTAATSSTSAASTSTSIQVSNLTNGNPYAFVVYATSAVGKGEKSAASAAVIPVTVPGAPTSVVATPGDRSASVAYTPPTSDGGSRITSYTAVSSNLTTAATSSTQSVASTSTSILVSSLTIGNPYSFIVYATSDVGKGIESAASAAVTPVTVPGAPTGVVATPGDRSASVAYTPPTSDGGSRITSYTAVSSNLTTAATSSTQSVASTSTSILVSSLTIGNPYSFIVYATSDVGKGIKSAASAVISPGTKPAPPTIDSALGGNGYVTVTFHPNGDGGVPITSYTATSPNVSGTFTISGDQLLSQPLAITVPGLTIGTNYTFNVTATNNNGISDKSALSAIATPHVISVGSASYNGGNAITPTVVTTNIHTVTYVFEHGVNGNSVFIAPAGCTRLAVEMVGSGGGGGFSPIISSKYYYGGGGGAGGYGYVSNVNITGHAGGAGFAIYVSPSFEGGSSVSLLNMGYTARNNGYENVIFDASGVLMQFVDGYGDPGIRIGCGGAGGGNNTLDISNSYLLGYTGWGGCGGGAPPQSDIMGGDGWPSRYDNELLSGESGIGCDHGLYGGRGGGGGNNGEGFQMKLINAWCCVAGISDPTTTVHSSTYGSGGNGGYTYCFPTASKPGVVVVQFTTY